MVTKKHMPPGLPEFMVSLQGHSPVLRERYRLRSLGVFGSYVKGRQRPGSDLDVLVEFEEGFRPALPVLVTLEAELSQLVGVKVDLVEKQALKPYIGRRVLAEVLWLVGGETATARPRGDELAREYLDFLHDIVHGMGQVERLLAGMTFEQVVEDERTILAVTKAVENIGEAAKHVPDEVRERFVDVPWGQMAAMRDRLAHGYFEVDLPVLWRVAREFIPPLRPELERILEAELQARGGEEDD